MQCKILLWKSLVLKLKAIRRAHKEEHSFIDNLDPIIDSKNSNPMKTNDGKDLT